MADPYGEGPVVSVVGVVVVGSISGSFMDWQQWAALWQQDVHISTALAVWNEARMGLMGLWMSADSCNAQNGGYSGAILRCQDRSGRSRSRRLEGRCAVADFFELRISAGFLRTQE